MIRTGPRKLLGPVCFLLLAFSPLPAPAQSRQEALLRAKPAVAIIAVEISADVTAVCADGRRVTAKAPALRDAATGWFISSSGWIVTTARALPAPGHSAIQEASLRDGGAAAAACGDARAVRSAHVSVRAPSVSVVLPNGRRLPARLVKYGAPGAGAAMSGRDLALLQVDARDLPTLPMADSNRVRIGDRVHIIGFPGVLMTHELLATSPRVDASVTSGAISGFAEDVNGQPVMQTDASAAGGDNGGPVVNDRGEVVGVLAFVSTAGDGTVVQGFNFIVPTAAVRDFVAGTGVALDDSGAFNREWWAALAAYFASDYAETQRRLAQANQIVPDLPDVRRLIGENDERIKNPPPRPFPWRAAGIVLTLVGGLACALAWRAWRERNRFRVRPLEVARWLEDGERAPLLLDVRDRETYEKSPVRLPRALHLPADSLAAGEPMPGIEPSRAVVAYCT